MESVFLTFILVFSFAVYYSHAGTQDWDDVVVAKENIPTILPCIDTTVRGAVAINWIWKSFGSDKSKMVLLANERKEISGGGSKASMRLADHNFQETGVFSLFFLPKMEDSGFYSCMIKQQGKEIKKIILLAILTVTVVPAAPIPHHSTLRLIASVNPDSAISKITWVSPDGVSMKSERKPNTGTVAKLPQVFNNDNGTYVCMVRSWGNGNNTLFPFNVDVTVDDDNVFTFTNITYAPLISTATKAQTSFTLTCPPVQGDYVLLHWMPPDPRKQGNFKLVYQYDRWRGTFLMSEQSKRVQLAGPPYNAEAGSFSFLLAPGLKEGGVYSCDVLLNDNAFSQRTQLSVLKVKTTQHASKMELVCLYSERSQVQSVNWKYQNKSRQLKMSSNNPGSISTTLPMPITSETAGNYTCTLQLKNGQIVWATQAVRLPYEEHVRVTPSQLPSLSALLLLVPLVAAAVCVLLWRQKHISDRGIEQSLSVQSREVENIYENPEDVRQAPPEGPVYMDLKPRGEDDVYKELERYEQCQS
ncbi:g6f-like isoform X1 [Larimichthys crocea]|uniref:g6f-like isoform X1 n=1 Tax=Larimichthys crocea TaxID=215358 RepID=UPI000F5FE7C7|nr:uncharacterized protein LOC104922287 isoform X1 [Larimichthys crocea]